MHPGEAVVYLHGFASSPLSCKARFFQQRFGELTVPDLTQGDFERSTLTRQLALLEALPAQGLLIGSSMGGYLAALYAARHAERVRGVVLLAPAFGMARRWGEQLGEAVMRDWREKGWRTVFHYGLDAEARISYDLISDGLRYEEFPEVRCPALVIHGRRDDSVDYRLSEQFAAGRPNVDLVLYDSDHQLLDVLEPMWERVAAFYRALPD